MSLTMSLAASETAHSACSIADSGDPENPPCSRLVLSGTFQNVTTGTAEWEQAKEALNSTHPKMAAWGCFSADGGACARARFCLLGKWKHTELGFSCRQVSRGGPSRANQPVRVFRLFGSQAARTVFSWPSSRCGRRG